jgi:hypothetical protein
MSTQSLEQRVTRLEAELARIKLPKPTTEAEAPWWKTIVGMHANNPYFEAVVEQGRAYRQSLKSIASATAELSDLPDQSMELCPLDDAIKHLTTPILVARDRGYSFAEIAQILTAQGVEISPEELQNYFSSPVPSSPVPQTFSPAVQSHRKRSKQPISSRPAHPLVVV